MRYRWGAISVVPGLLPSVCDGEYQWLRRSLSPLTTSVVGLRTKVSCPLTPSRLGSGFVEPTVTLSETDGSPGIWRCCTRSLSKNGPSRNWLTVVLERL